MKFDNYLTDQVVLQEMGARIRRHRLDAALTQAQLAQAGGIAKRTLERLESGAGTDSQALIRILRALGRLGDLENLLPDTRQNPLTLLKQHGAERRRVRTRRAIQDPPAAAPPGNNPRWTWGN